MLNIPACNYENEKKRKTCSHVLFVAVGAETEVSSTRRQVHPGTDTGGTSPVSVGTTTFHQTTNPMKGSSIFSLCVRLLFSCSDGS